MFFFSFFWAFFHSSLSPSTDLGGRNSYWNIIIHCERSNVFLLILLGFFSFFSLTVHRFRRYMTTNRTVLFESL